MSIVKSMIVAFALAILATSASATGMGYSSPFGGGGSGGPFGPISFPSGGGWPSGPFGGSPSGPFGGFPGGFPSGPVGHFPGGFPGGGFPGGGPSFPGGWPGGGGGEDCDPGFPTSQTPVVPLPGGLPLAAGAFGLLALTKKRRKTA